MSLDLFERETNEWLARMPGVALPEVGAWDGFIRGTALSTMRGLAKAGRAVDLLGSVGPIVQDAFTGGTEAQDRYFGEHKEIWGSAVDYWTPAAREVGVAGEIAGMLLSTLPLIIASPAFAVGQTQLSVAQDLVDKGVDSRTAQIVGASQAAGLGLGIYMPIFGQTLTQRVLAGGIGFNVLQGIGMRGFAEQALRGTPAQGEYKAFDPTALKLDVLLGAAFGFITHLSPTQRAQGAAMWERLAGWGKGMKQSDIDALMVLRQAQHLNIDSMPAKPAEPVDIERHSARVRQAIEQLARNEPVEVTDLQPARFEADPARLKDMAARARELADVAETVRVSEGLPPPPRLQIPEFPGLSPELRQIEARARAQVLGDLEGTIKAYERLPDTDGGRILNVDIMRELFADYRADRSINAPGVHEPASAVIKEIYARKLTQPDPLGLDMVTFTAGGTAAGKSSSHAAVPLVKSIVGASQILYDTNMAGFRSAVDKIDLALQAGKQANIVFVGADPVEAFRRMLSRAMKIGRTVPLEEHAKTHRGAVATLEPLMERYRGNDKVQFIVLDNGVGAKGEAVPVELPRVHEYLRKINFDNLEPRLREVLDDEFKAGRISEKVYRGVAHALAGGAGEAPGARGAREPARGGEGLPRAEGEVGKQVRTRLTGVGFEPPEAAANAAIWDHFFAAAAKRYGTAAEDLYRTYAGDLEVRRAREGEMAGALRQGALPREDLGRAPKPGEKFLVFRLGTNAEIEGRNAGNSKGVAEHLARLDDIEGPRSKSGQGTKLFAYEVEAGKFGSYEPGTGAGVAGKVMGRRDNKGAISYSFPKGTKGRLLGELPIEEVRAQLKKMGYADFDDAGWQKGGEAIRKAFTKVFHQAGRGAIEFQPGRTIIGLFEGADKSTFQHESAHFFLETTRKLATAADAPSAARVDWQEISDWLGLKKGAEIPTEAHETFAKGWERYLMEGKAPKPELAGVFEQFKQWLTNVYRDLVGLNVEISDPVRRLFDRMLGEEAPTTLSKAPAAKAGGEAEPPPPRGRAAAEAAGAADTVGQMSFLEARAQAAGFKGLEDLAAKDIGLFMKLAEEWRAVHPGAEAGKADPLRTQAEAIVNERPDMLLRVGEDQNGKPILKTAREFMDKAIDDAKAAREDISLFEVAAQCLLGRG